MNVEKSRIDDDKKTGLKEIQTTRFNMLSYVVKGKAPILNDSITKKKKLKFNIQYSTAIISLSPRFSSVRKFIR